MITGLNHLHSSFRYLVLLFIIIALVDAILGLKAQKEYKKSSKLFALGALILCHIQLVVGLLLYFLGSKGFNAFSSGAEVMKEPLLRFYAVEHISMMILAVALITIGYSKAKRIDNPASKFKTIAWTYGIGLLIIFVMIPWPFLKEWGSWM